LALFALLGACEPPVVERAQQAQYEPGAPYATTCPCQAIHGTCDSSCLITCESGYADCNGDVSDGCEANLSDPSTCGDCKTDCNECNDHATCNAGKCAGTALPNGSACQAMATGGTGCSNGVCGGGECRCADGLDLSVLPPAFKPPPDMARGGRDVSGCACNLAGGGSATATVVLMLGIAMLLYRRRLR
jgi:hypothetical protein